MAKKATHTYVIHFGASGHTILDVQNDTLYSLEEANKEAKTKIAENICRMLNIK